MTREEMITNLEKLAALFYTESEQSKMVDYSKIIETLEFAAAALRPVSREQVEKMFPRCPKCRYEDGKEPMDIYYPDGWDNGIGFEYGKAIFCPKCGRPLTDEAVQMVMVRLEALKDGTDD